MRQYALVKEPVDQMTRDQLEDLVNRLYDHIDDLYNELEGYVWTPEGYKKALQEGRDELRLAEIQLEFLTQLIVDAIKGGEK